MDELRNAAMRHLETCAAYFPTKMPGQWTTLKRTVTTFSAFVPTMKNRNRSSSTFINSILCKKMTKTMSVTKSEPRTVLSESVTAGCVTEKGYMNTSSTATNRSA